MVLGSYANHIKATCLCVDPRWGGVSSISRSCVNCSGQGIGKEAGVIWRHCVLMFDGAEEIRTTFFQKCSLTGDVGALLTSYVLWVTQPPLAKMVTIRTIHLL
jgi:hypothetical protein